MGRCSCPPSAAKVASAMNCHDHDSDGKMHRYIAPPIEGRLYSSQLETEASCGDRPSDELRADERAKEFISEATAPLRIAATSPADRAPVPRPAADPRAAALRRAMPACQPQEGSIGSRVAAFTPSELEALRVELRPRHAPDGAAATRITTAVDQHHGDSLLDNCQPWGSLSEASSTADSVAFAVEQAPPLAAGSTSIPVEQRDKDVVDDSGIVSEALDYFGAPRFAAQEVHGPRRFRRLCREGLFAGPTNGQCPGFLQCNLVVLPWGPVAFDFLLFCQRNPKACPLIEVCEGGSPRPVGVALGADLRTDLPRYAIYRDGRLEREVTDVLDCWPDDAVSFLIGCSFSYDGALLAAGIPLRSADHGRNVPMYRTHLKCRSAGSLRGNLVVSMKPVPALQVARAAEITAQFPHAHGGPVAVGCADALGVRDLARPDWGEPVPVGPDEVPVFHACGVTPQAVIQASRVPFAITHAAGHMFVTDLPADMKNL